jgi:prepilin-type N-terminal cleavage/methylation domain-containing protein
MSVKKQKSGFTLIELAVVLAIFAILFCIVMFSFSAAKQATALQNATVVMMTDLKKQRQRTVAVENKCGIEIRNNGYICYETLKDKAGDASGTETKVYADASVDFTRLLGIVVNIAQPPAGTSVEFTPAVPVGGDWAALQCASPSTITLQCGNQSRTITVTASGEINAN